MNYYSVGIRKIKQQATAQMSLQNVTLRERSQTQKTICSVMFHSHEVQEEAKIIYGVRSQKVVVELGTDQKGT